MGDKRTSNFVGTVLGRQRALFGGRLFERLRHVLWAGLISLAMFAVLLFEPVDQFLWLIQSRIADRSPSGDIVFVASDEALNDPDMPQRRYDVAAALDELDRRGVGKVFLDVTFAQSEDTRADQRLSRSIADLGPRITLVDRIVVASNGRSLVRETEPSIAGSVFRVVSDQTDRNWFGLAWELQYSYDVAGKLTPSLGAAIGGIRGANGQKFSVDYGFSQTRIPVLPIEHLFENKYRLSDGLTDVTGKTVILGHSNRVTGTQQPIPGRMDAPASFVDIYAGETLKSGRTQHIRGPIVLAFHALLLSLVVVFGGARRRRWPAYSGIVLLAPAVLFAAAKLGVRLDLSYALGFLGIYGAMRSRMRWKRRVEMVNSETGLPKLRALEARLLRETISNGHVVIAKIQNYERVLKTLRTEDKSSYVLKLVDRLRAADPNLVVYSDGHHLGWYVASDDTDDVTDHLEGLRAIFAAPVEVGGFSVDVGITFGIASIDGDPAARLAAAVAAAEETSEAHNPIAIAETGSQSDLLWDISLRARIDEAMEVGEIYCVYQPKIDLGSKTTVGVEALVRWHDPARGFISPMHFIQQCEKAGRMEHLTRYVLQSACSAGQLLHFRGQNLTMSVNISATLLGDMRIAGIVRNALQATRFDPQFLVLEITETSRISDHSVASSILEELKSTGVKISMDDFGVGSASYEAFYELPFDEIKIDRLFVSNMAKDPKARAIVASIAAMGREARITVVAEGLENPQDIGLLEAIGCQQVQGFAFSRPVSLSNLLESKDIDGMRAAANMV
ncbi:EAL domain-containing protein [Qipengyuania qiaonensis]|uniref:EAL domain-containing protein n=1 Tax=Qipengyuania qiaonensis TaxID=2867240 RepID=A0ABS7JFM4_9SPHN|nr:EAL domain-containing protein [Qipengyuania qiaonensis]MBX7483837.1 EAL domain-containing protein [Qipengyuania qiaonensis]